MARIFLKDDKKPLNYVLSGVFFFLVWTRYEGCIYLLLTVPFLLVIYRKKIDYKYLFLSILLFLILIFPYPILNNYFYGSPFSIGYAVTGNMSPSIKISSRNELFDQIKIGVSKIYNNFPVLRKNFFSEKGIIGGLTFILDKFNRYIFNLYTIPTLLGGIGLFVALRKKYIFIYRTLLIFVSFLWIF